MRSYWLSALFSSSFLSYRRGIIGIGVDYGQQNATTYQAAGLNEYEHKLDGLAEYYHSGRETGAQKSPSEYAGDFVKFLNLLHETYSCSYFYTFIDPSARGLMEEIKRATRGIGYNVLIRDAENDVALEAAALRIQIFLVPIPRISAPIACKK